MSVTTCDECGAIYTADGDSCSARFDQLLALDHSRREPWGSRHGQAFAAFALQHPRTFDAALDHAWAALHRIYVEGVDARRVYTELVRGGGELPHWWLVIPRPARRVAVPATVTIGDLGDFAAETYPLRLDAWCRASLASWGGETG